MILHNEVAQTTTIVNCGYFDSAKLLLFRSKLNGVNGDKCRGNK